MQTDIPLKRLTELRAADLLLLLGTPDAQVLAVETLELPASATRLDNLLHLRSPQGQDYLHVIEWQAYHDATVLWRLAGYLAWLGQRNTDKTIVGTLVYLTPAADVDHVLRQQIDGQTILEWSIPCVRLWTQDAHAALQHGSLGLVVLSPLMGRASAGLVEHAILRVLAEAPLPQQADLLSILGIFAEPLIDRDRFVRLVGKERLMTSDLLTYLMEEKLAAKDAAFRQSLQHTLIKALSARFPQAPITLVDTIHHVTNLDQLQQLIVAVVQAADLAEIEHALTSAAATEHEAGGDT